MLLLGGRRLQLDDKPLDWNCFFKFLLNGGDLFKLIGREVDVGRGEWRVHMIV
jgi:hypothetical protein